MRRRDWYDRRLDKRVALQIAEEEGVVADSTEFRQAWSPSFSLDK